MLLQRRPKTLTAYLLLLGVTLVWGSTFSLVKAALADTSPLTFNLLRMGLAFAVLAAVNFRSLRGVTRLDLKLGAMTGLCLALGYQFQTAGLARTTASKSAFLTGLVVVFVPLLGALPGVSGPNSPRPSADTFLGAFLAFAGLVFLTIPAGSGSSLLSGMRLGEWLSLLCAVSFAAHLLVLARAAPRVSARRLGMLQIGFAALAMLLTLPLGGPIYVHSSRALWLALAVTAILATAAAFTLQSWAQQHLPATHIALIFTMEPVFAWLTALLFFHERLGQRALLGAGLILAGILFAELKPTSRRVRPLLPVAGA